MQTFLTPSGRGGHQRKSRTLRKHCLLPRTRVYTIRRIALKMPTCPQIHPQDSQADYPLKTKLSRVPELQRVPELPRVSKLSRVSKLPRVPDLDNRRFCRACECTLPLSAFPSGTRRFLCKKHIWERIQQPSKRRALANNPHKRKLWTLWKKCWNDAKRTFHHDRILLLQRDIEETLAQLEGSSHSGKQEASCQELIRDTRAEVQATSDTSTVPPDAQPTSDLNAQPTSDPNAQPTSDLNAQPTSDTTSDTSTVPPDTQPTSDLNAQPTSDLNAQLAAQPTSDHNARLATQPTSDLNARLATQPTSDLNTSSTADPHITAKERQQDIALLPCDPESHVSRDNFVVVDRNARRILLKAYREGGAVCYKNELQALD